MTVGVLLLAAGRSIRFGSDKRLALLPNGKSLLEATLDNIEASHMPVLVCLENDQDGAAKICDRMGVKFKVCESASLGMGYTLGEGIAGIPHWQGVLVALADMPFVRATTYSQLGDASSADTICRPQCDGQVGHPVAFGAHYFGELMAHTGDFGARDILKKYAARINTVDCADPGILRDIDRVGDLSALVP